MRTGLAVAAILTGAACAPVRMALEPVVPPCRVEGSAADPVRWITPFESASRRFLGAWCETVGPVAVYRRTGIAPSSGPVIVVTWNVHVGAGDVRLLLATIRKSEAAAGRQEPQFILLLQEAYRRGPAVPIAFPRDSHVPRRLGVAKRPVPSEILDIAAQENLNAIYIPSMRNGREGSQGHAGDAEDRGNAILSTLPLSRFAGIELPVSSQRRVAVAATVGDGEQSLTVMSVHFDTALGHARQADGLIDALRVIGETGPVVVAGDFNSTTRLDRGVRRLRGQFGPVACGAERTHKIFRLDHIFARGVAPIESCTTLRDKYGSDHAPVVLRLAGLPARTPRKARPVVVSRQRKSAVVSVNQRNYFLSGSSVRSGRCGSAVPDHGARTPDFT